MMPTSRTIHAGIALICTALIGFALYLQHAQGLEPCPLCILQRYAFIVVGVIALIAALHGPRGIGRWLYGIALIVAAGIGGGIAIRNVYLEHKPPSISHCGAALGYMMESFPLAEALPMIFRGTGDCSQVLWQFLGLSIAEWSLVWFAIFLVAAAVSVRVPARRRG